MTEFPELDRLDVETPLGVVHLAGFVMDGPHREVIFRILREASGEPIAASDLQESEEDPRPRFPKLDFDVNWTHSKGYCVVAYGDPATGKDLLVGVDLERHSPKHLRLAERFYNAQEITALRELENRGIEAQTVEFYRLWSRKEALYKCVGGSFFEGAIGRSVLEDSVWAGPEGGECQVHFVDLDGQCFSENKKGAGFPAALCVAVSRKSNLD